MHRGASVGHASDKCDAPPLLESARAAAYSEAQANTTVPDIPSLTPASWPPIPGGEPAGPFTSSSGISSLDGQESMDSLLLQLDSKTMLSKPALGGGGGLPASVLRRGRVGLRDEGLGGKTLKQRPTLGVNDSSGYKRPTTCMRTHTHTHKHTPAGPPSAPRVHAHGPNVTEHACRCARTGIPFRQARAYPHNSEWMGVEGGQSTRVTNDGCRQPRVSCEAAECPAALSWQPTRLQCLIPTRPPANR